LNLIQFAQDATSMEGQFELRDLPRLALEQTQSAQAQANSPQVKWSLLGEPDMQALEVTKLSSEPRAPRAAAPQALVAKLGLTLDAQTSIELTCQRCLSPVVCALQAHRQFRFALDEAAALALDDELEDDVLVLSQSFDAMELIEDELIMAMPLVAMHESCPVSLAQHSGEAIESDLNPEKPNPFAVLAQLKTKRG
jgi:uncharacterized protein